jgi:uncharacterized protein YggE
MIEDARATGPTVTVLGEASLRVRPDQAQIQLEFKVERRSDDAQGRRGSERAVTFALEG